jgi:hypothetical protein
LGRSAPLGSVYWTELKVLRSILFVGVVREFAHQKNSSVDVLNYLHPLLKFLSTPAGLAAFVVGLLVLGYGLQGRRGKEVLIFIAVLTGMVGYFVSKYWNNTLIAPLEDFRAFCKPLFIISIASLALRYFLTQSTLRQAPPRGAALAFLVLMLAYALRGAVPAPERAVAGSIAMILMFYGVIQLVRRSTRTGEDLAAALSAIVLAGMTFYLFSIIQLIFGAHDSIVFANRFAGLSDNPQNVGENTACLILVANYLIVSGYSSRRQKLLGIVAVALMFPFLLWTGSRTSAGMVAVGLFIMNGTKVRQWVVFGSLAAVAWEAYSHFYRGADVAAVRLGSTVNDRSAGWIHTWGIFLKHPIFGKFASHTWVENSYLSVAGDLGLLGVAVLVVLMELQARDMLHIFRYRSRLNPKGQRVCDLALGLSTALAAGMVFDAYLLSLSTTQGFFVALALALTGVAVDQVDAVAHPAHAGAAPIRGPTTGPPVGLGQS